MNTADKSLIYNLLKASACNINGYTPQAFTGSEPVWTDDSVKTVESNSVNSHASDSFSDSTITSSQNNIISQVTQKQDTISVESNQESLNSSKLSLKDIADKISRCTRCSLARTRNNVVPGMGVEHPDVLVIGEGPGADEDMQGLPFVGKAGILLDRMLAAIQLDRKTNCYIANIVKCRPPQNRVPYPEEQDSCFSFLEAQINILKPKMILCMGKTSAGKMLNNDSPIGQIRGQFFEYNHIPLLVTYHPSALLRNEELKKPAWEDLKKFKARLDQIRANDVSSDNS